MHKNNFYISFGVWIVVLPLLGIPGTWKNTLVFLSGVFFILVLLWPAIMKKLQAKPKPKKKASKITESTPPQDGSLRFSDTNIQTEIETEKEL